MSPEHTDALLSSIRDRASALISAPNVLSLVAHLDNLPGLVAELNSAFAQTPLSHTQHQATREALLHLQRALIYIHSRLQHEHGFLLGELKELAIQQEWAERSRQITS